MNNCQAGVAIWFEARQQIHFRGYLFPHCTHIHTIRGNRTSIYHDSSRLMARFRALSWLPSLVRMQAALLLLLGSQGSHPKFIITQHLSPATTRKGASAATASSLLPSVILASQAGHGFKNCIGASCSGCARNALFRT